MASTNFSKECVAWMPRYTGANSLSLGISRSLPFFHSNCSTQWNSMHFSAYLFRSENMVSSSFFHHPQQAAHGFICQKVHKRCYNDGNLDWQARVTRRVIPCDSYVLWQIPTASYSFSVLHFQRIPKVMDHPQTAIKIFQTTSHFMKQSWIKKMHSMERLRKRSSNHIQSEPYPMPPWKHMSPWKHPGHWVFSRVWSSALDCTCQPKMHQDFQLMWHHGKPVISTVGRLKEETQLTPAG